MSFHEVRFPEDNNSYGSRGGPGYRTSVVESDSGAEQRVGRWSAARHRYSIDLTSLDPSHLAEVKTFYIARRGAEIGFRLKDWTDFTSHPESPSFHDEPGIADQECVPSQGTGTLTTFQLVKTYTSGPASEVRFIWKPVVDTVRIWVDGVEQMSGWTVDTTTGVVTFTTAPDIGDDIKASFEFDVPVRFDAAADELMSISVDDWGSQSAASLGMVEIFSPGAASHGDFNPGGSKELSILADYTVSLGVARMWVVNATLTDLSVIMPVRSGIPTGCPIFQIINGGSNTFTVKDELDTTLATLTTNQGVEVGLTLDIAGTARTWYAM